MRTVLALTLASLVVCGAPASAAPPAKVVTQSDTGGTVTLVPGQRLRIELGVCYSCGYHWETRQPPSPHVLRRLAQRQSSGCRPPCVGGSAITKFRYVARASGR